MRFDELRDCRRHYGDRANRCWNWDSRSPASTNALRQGTVEKVAWRRNSTALRWYDSHSRGPLVRSARDRKEGLQDKAASAGLNYENQSTTANKIRSLHRQQRVLSV